MSESRSGGPLAANLVPTQLTRLPYLLPVLLYLFSLRLFSRETNLKVRQALPETQELGENTKDLAKFGGRSFHANLSYLRSKMSKTSYRCKLQHVKDKFSFGPNVKMSKTSLGV